MGAAPVFAPTKRPPTWLRRLIEGWQGRDAGPGIERLPEIRPRGFAEAALPIAPAAKPPPSLEDLQAMLSRMEPQPASPAAPGRAPPDRALRDHAASDGPASQALASEAPPPGREDPGPRPLAAFASTGPNGHRARLREKVLTRGTDALADYELLEMLLFFAFRTGDTKPLAKTLINRFGSFAGVLAAPRQVLLETPGLGPHSVSAILVAQASAVRLSRAELVERPVLNDMERLAGYLQTTLARERVEAFHVLFLDPRNRLIADEALGRGTVNHTPVYPREIVKRALELHCTALILVHNHPSGDPTPSAADIEMTGDVVRAAEALEIVVHDHIIVGNGTWTSFREAGLMP